MDSKHKWHNLLTKPKNPYTLMPAQERAISIAIENNGGYLAIPVGHGKTLLAFCLLTIMNAERPILICPSRLRKQAAAAYKNWSQYYNINPVPAIAYEWISMAAYEDMLWQLRPTHIILDEAHCMMNAGNTRSKRLRAYLEDRPETIVVAMSGTLFKRNIDDMYFMTVCTLRENTFLPKVRRERDAMTKALFFEEEATNAHFSTANRVLKKYTGNTLAKKYRNMLETSSGVYIPAPKEGVTSSLELACVDLIMPKDIKHAIDHAGDLENAVEELRDGDEITSNRMRQLHSGFYYRYAWEEVGGKDMDWVVAKKRWNMCLATELEYRSRRGYDSALLVTRQLKREIEKEGRRDSLAKAWIEWEVQKKKPEPPRYPVYLSAFVFEWLGKWLDGQPPTLIWCSYLAQLSALDVLGIPLLDNIPQGKWGSKHAVVSTHRHSKGLELQMYAHNVVLTPTKNSTIVEQYLGRTHRLGQEADTVYCTFLTHGAYGGIIDSCKENAKLDETTTGARQKMLYGTWV